MLGLITIVAIQRAIHKVLISVFLSREFKHDETNRAWWTGKWYGRGLGSHALSQPAREFIVKIIELSLWSSDFLIGHFLLIMLTPALLVPYSDRLHSILLCKYPLVLLCGQGVFNSSLSVWLRPSKQIHAPIFNIKVRKQRRAIVSIFLGPSGLSLWSFLFLADNQIRSNILFCHRNLCGLDCYS